MTVALWAASLRFDFQANLGPIDVVDVFNGGVYVLKDQGTPYVYSWRVLTFPNVQARSRVRWWFAWTDFGNGSWALHIPLWAPVAAFGLPIGVAWVRRWRCRAASTRDSCPACNYSLTGLAPGSPCPECGKRGGGEAKA